MLHPYTKNVAKVPQMLQRIPQMLQSKTKGYARIWTVKSRRSGGCGLTGELDCRPTGAERRPIRNHYCDEKTAWILCTYFDRSEPWLIINLIPFPGKTL